MTSIMPQRAKSLAEKRAGNMARQARYREREGRRKEREKGLQAEAGRSVTAVATAAEQAEQAHLRVDSNSVARNEFPLAMKPDGNQLNRTASSTKASHVHAVRAHSSGEMGLSIQVACRQLVLVFSLMTA